MLLAPATPDSSQQSQVSQSARARTISAWLLIAFFVVLFALESTPIFGSNRTTGPVHSVAHFILGTRLDKHWDFFHHVMRKMCHFVGCGMFSMVCFRGLSLSLRHHASKLQQRLLSHSGAIAAVILVASLDEIHQSFMPNRTGCFADVLLDTSGAVAFQFAFFLTSFAAVAWVNYRNIDFFDTSHPQQEQAA